MWFLFSPSHLSIYSCLPAHHFTFLSIFLSDHLFTAPSLLSPTTCFTIPPLLCLLSPTPCLFHHTFPLVFYTPTCFTTPFLSPTPTCHPALHYNTSLLHSLFTVILLSFYLFTLLCHVDPPICHYLHISPHLVCLICLSATLLFITTLLCYTVILSSQFLYLLRLLCHVPSIYVSHTLFVSYAYLSPYSSSQYFSATQLCIFIMILSSLTCSFAQSPLPRTSTLVQSAFKGNTTRVY